MKIIVITSPDKMPGEVSTICRLLNDGIDSIHIRKPDWNETQCRELIEAIPEQYRCQLVLHQYFELCEEYHLKGIHLNKRHSYPPVDHKGTISCSCAEGNNSIRLILRFAPATAIARRSSV